MLKGILFDNYEVEIDPRSPALGGSWQKTQRDGKPLVWDEDLVRFFFRKLNGYPRPSVFLDIGASTGSFCLLTSVLPGFTCYAFEPCNLAREILEANVVLNGLQVRVIALPYALSNTHGKGILRIPNVVDFGCACLSDNPLRYTPVSEQAVELLTLDELVLPAVSCVKIDVEGYELMVLQGGALFFQTQHPAVLLEYDERNTPQFGYERGKIVKLLQSWGYKTFEFLGPDGRDLWTTP